MERAYLDYNASAPLLQAAREAMNAAMDLPGNASSVHAEGRGRRHLLETARRDVAALVGGQPDRVIFTSGASEAAAMALSPRYHMGRAPLAIAQLFVAASDHPCILQGGRFAPEQVLAVPVDGQGIMDLAFLPDALARHAERDCGPALVACHHANNETGVIQPAAEIGGMVRAAGGIFVLDAVQTAGRVAIDMEEIGADFVVLSSHKIGGPQGAGALVAASDLLMPEPLLRGGGQEKGHRAGTENVAAIAGFGAAARIARETLAAANQLAGLRGRFEQALLSAFPDAQIVAAAAPRLPNTILFTVPGMKAETLQIAFDLAGIALSAGSACSSGRVGDSHVLQAMGLEGSGLRLSIGNGTGERELALFAEAAAAIGARRAGAHAA